MNRSSVYHKDSQPYRVISVKEGKWQLQNRVAETGTKTTDCWISIRRPTSKADALNQMYTQAPAKRA